LDEGYVAETANQTKLSKEKFANVIKNLPNSSVLKTIIYCISYARSFEKINNSNDGEFNGWDYNFGTVSLDVNYGATSSSFLKKYSCVNVQTTPSTNDSLPMANFSSVESYVNFMSARLFNNEQRVLDLGLVKYYVCFYPEKNINTDYYDANINEFKTIRNTMNKALTSALEVGIATKEIVDSLKKQIKDTDNNASGPNVTPTPSPIPPLPGQSCPPPVISSFSPLSGNTGTIVQLNGRNFNGVKSIKINGVDVGLTDITIFNDSTLKVVTPKVGTGDVVNKGFIVITTDFGSYTTIDQYTYDPALPASAAASPGSYQNPQNQTANLPQSETTNANQQLYGPDPLISETENLFGGRTGKVTISVNPQVGVWILDNKVEMSISIFDEVIENNNVKTTLNRMVNTDITNYVNNNVFTITYNQIADMLINTPISQFVQNPIRNGQVVTINFCATSSAVDKVKYPNQALKCVNFYFEPSTLTPNSQPVTPSQLSIISLGESDDTQGNGFDYINIKKPAGGYITLKFNSGDKPFNDQWVGSSQFFKVGSSFPSTSSCNAGASTNYTKVCTINDLGVFTLVMEYFPNGFVGDKELVTSPPFTL
jgi:hypothetical protein